MERILSKEEVAEISSFGVVSLTNKMLQKLCASHEALRRGVENGQENEEKNKEEVGVLRG